MIAIEFGIICGKRIESFCVSDVPILHLSLGSNLNPDDIEEGDDVYFECKVNANPSAYKVLWKHNVSFCLIFLDYRLYSHRLIVGKKVATFPDKLKLTENVYFDFVYLRK